MAGTVEARDAMRTDLNREAGLSLQILLPRIRIFVEERGPELLADFFGPFAKWGLILLHFLIDCDPDVKRITRFIFGVDTDRVRGPLRKSPLQIVSVVLRDLVSAINRDMEAATRSSALVVCRLLMMMLLMMVGGWKGVISFYVGFCVYHLDRVSELVTDEEALFFHAANLILYACDRVAIPETMSCGVLLLLLGLVLVFSVRNLWKTEEGLYIVPAFVSGSVILFYTPLWFGLCVLACLSVASCLRYGRDSDDFIGCLFFCSIGYSLLCLVAYLSGGGLHGALVVPVLFLIFGSIAGSDSELTGLEMAAPLPFMCALLCCTFYPSLGMIGITSAILCSLGLGYGNGKVVLWWFSLLVALLALSSRAFSNGSFIVVMGAFSSYFTYGYIL